MANFWHQIKPSFSIESIENTPRFHTVRWIVFGVFLSLMFGLVWQLFAFYRVNFYPQTFINGVDVSNLSVPAAQEKLASQRPTPPAFTVMLQAGDTTLSSTSSELAAMYSYTTDIPELFARTNQINFLQQLGRVLGTRKTLLTTPITTDARATQSLITILAKSVDESNKIASISLQRTGAPTTLTVQPGVSGEVLDQTTTQKNLLAAITTLSQTLGDPATPKTDAPTQLMVTAPKQNSRPPLSETEQAALKQVAAQFINKTLKLTVQRQNFVWSDQILVGLLNPYLDPKKPETYLDSANLTAELTKIAVALPSQPVNAAFDYDPQTLVVKTFNPGKDGLVLDVANSQTAIMATLLSWLQTDTPSEQQTIQLKADAKAPDITLAETNSLGIKEVLGFGESFYAQSIPARIYNVALTAKKINLTLVKPGAEFSFNQALGEVSAVTGFKQAYVIKDGKTVLGDGGGVCQVSSTFFRALLNGGMNITLRRPHSYRVTYYELNSDPGFDATVYEGVVDLRFLNDTPGYLLVYTETDDAKLWMKVEIYGTKDGRVSEISDYKTWDAVPAKPTEYALDPSLPSGAKKQIDWAAAGLKTSFVYTVKNADGTTKQKETYSSNYQAWSAKYLVGP